MCIFCCPPPAPVAKLQRNRAHCVLAIIRSRACVQDLQREHLISRSHGRRRGAQHHTTPSINQQQQRMASLVREAIGGQQWKDRPSAAAGAPVSASSASRFDCCCVLLSGCVASLLGSMRVPIYHNRWYSGKISDLLCNAVSALEAHDACQPLHCMQACSLLPVQHASTDRLVWCWVQISNGILYSGSIDVSQLRGPQHGNSLCDLTQRGRQ